MRISRRDVFLDTLLAQDAIAFGMPEGDFLGRRHVREIRRPVCQRWPIGLPVGGLL